MNYDSKIDDRILENVLLRTDSATADDQGDVVDEADELFALMLEKGKLDESDHEQLMRCLDANPTTRQAISRFIIESAGQLGEPQPACPSPARSKQKVARQPSGAGLRGIVERLLQEIFGQRRLAYAFAVALLAVATMGWLWVSSSNGPHPMVAMLSHPNVFDLGFDPEVVERGEPSEAPIDIPALLAEVSTSEREQLLTAYRDLQTNHLPQAREKFDAILNRDPSNYFANLGVASAFFMEQRPADFEQAIPYFQKALEIQPGSTAARIGLAATLSQLGRSDQALTHWQAALANEHLPADQREMIDNEIKKAITSDKAKN